MKNINFLKQGLVVALGSFVYNIAWPLLNNESVMQGAKKGLLTGVLIVFVFLIIARIKPGNNEKSTDVSDS